jgi:hypothetical protein
MNEQKVFLSYARADWPLVQSAMRRLRNSDLRSAKIDDPADWSATADDPRSALSEKIRQADTFILVWSDRAAQSPWVQYELGIANALGLPIRVFRAGETSIALPAELADAQVVELEVAKPQPLAGDSHSDRLAAAVEVLSRQSQRIEAQLGEVHTILAGSNYKRGSGAAGQHKRLGAAAKSPLLPSLKKKRDKQRSPQGATKQRAPGGKH